ncbi:hypothetical protein [Methylobacterium sp. Leaf466]|uniref:hypothetical protein n=1 Tax=Methylobacterium sp. Leaf466 TaxID=1736386 RepID=UPI0006F39688|nr:hypothetical protein [Methylobacterium sp. Leaf466]KQT82439.1 hypothetical protein ASG59_18780 [Methylobacterium sp. Leaf466]
MSVKKENRQIPRYKLTVDPEWFWAHRAQINEWAITQSEPERYFDYVIEMVPGTSQMTGKLYFVHSGHSTLMAAYIKTLKEGNS